MTSIDKSGINDAIKPTIAYARSPQSYLSNPELELTFELLLSQLLVSLIMEAWSE